MDDQGPCITNFFGIPSDKFPSIQQSRAFHPDEPSGAYFHLKFEIS
jgi:hypothetical protein